MWKVMSSVNSDILLLPFQFVCLISFSCWIAMARTSSIMLNNSSKNGYPCLNPDLRERAFSLSTFSTMFAVGFPYMAFIMFRKLPSILVCWVLLSGKDVEFCWMPFQYQLRWSYGFYHFVNIIYYIDWFVYAEPSLHFSYKSHLVMVYNPLSMLMNSVFLFRVFASIFIKNSMQSFLYPCLSLFGSGIREIPASQNEFRNITSSSILWNSEKNWCWLFFKCLVWFSSEAMRSWAFLSWEVFDSCFYLLTSYR